MQKIGRNILLKQAREEKGWTQHRLADELGVEEQTIRSWEHGRRKPLREYRIRLSEIFGKTPEQLGFPSTESPESEPSDVGSAPVTHVSDALPLPAETSLFEDPARSFLQQAGPSVRVPKKEEQNRQRMFNRVRTTWIQGVLQHSLYQEVLVTLGLLEQPSALVNPWRFTVQETNVPPHTVAANTSIVEVYEQAGGELLILGEPGAGKTTLLLELARELLTRAERDEALPIPVVFHLSSWSEKFRASFADWLVDELNSKYQVPRTLGYTWVHDDQLVLLLDGLDEVESAWREGCLEAIDHYHELHHLVPIIVCSREAEYMMQPKRLNLQRAVVVQPLTLEQVDDYLSRMGEKTEDIRSAFHDDPELQEVLSTPLMLNVFTLAYNGKLEKDLHTHDSPETRRGKVFTSYVQRMLARRGAKTRYTPQQTIHYLSVLAQNMRKRSQTEFSVERMQPDWLSDSRVVKQYRLAVIRIIFGLAIMVSAGIFACFRGDSYPTQPGLFFWVGGGIGSSVLGWMAPGIGIGVKGASCLGILQVIVMVVVIVLFDRRTIPLVSKRAILSGLRNSIRYSILVGCIVGVFSLLIFTRIGGLSYGLFRGGGIGLFSGLVMASMSGLLGLLRYDPTLPINDKAQRNKQQVHFLRDRLLNTLVFSVCASAAFTSLYALQSGGISRLVLGYGLIVGFFYGLIFGLGNGTDLVHGLGISIQPAETASWSWVAAREALMTNAKQGIRLGGTIFVGVTVVIAGMTSFFNGVKYGLRFGLIFGLIVGLISTVAAILTGVLTSGWSSDIIDDTHQFVRPNEGIRRSASNALLAALLFGLLGGIASGLIGGLSFGLAGIEGWRVLAIGFMIVFGVIFAFHFLILYGEIAVIEHYVLRWYLWRKGSIPLNYIAFLNYATERILLRRIGGRYIFTHRLLQDYFSSLENEEPTGVTRP